MITDFKIFEGKQVGIIYHLTDNLYNLKRMLKDDEMKSKYGYISFSRNKNFSYRSRTIKIIFDGNQMSNRFKFEPYSYSKNVYTDESEERIICNRKNIEQREDEMVGKQSVNSGYHFDMIKGIKKYIIGIEIIKIYYNDEYNKKSIEEIQELIPNVKIKLIKR